MFGSKQSIFAFVANTTALVIVAMLFIFSFFFGQQGSIYANVNGSKFSEFYEKATSFSWLIDDIKSLNASLKGVDLSKYAGVTAIAQYAPTIINIVVVAFLAHVNVVTEIVLNVLFIVAIGLLFISSFVIVIINDIGSHKDDKKRFYLETGERKVYEIQDIPSFVDNLNNKLMSKVISLGIQQRNNTYFTIYNLRDSYYTKIEKAKNDITKIENINKEYINYFKNIEKLVVLKENKDGTLVFRK